MGPVRKSRRTCHSTSVFRNSSTGRRTRIKNAISLFETVGLEEQFHTMMRVLRPQKHFGCTPRATLTKYLVFLHRCVATSMPKCGFAGEAVLVSNFVYHYVLRLSPDQHCCHAVPHCQHIIFVKLTSERDNGDIINYVETTIAKVVQQNRLQSDQHWLRSRIIIWMYPPPHILPQNRANRATMSEDKTSRNTPYRRIWKTP